MNNIPMKVKIGLGLLIASASITFFGLMVLLTVYGNNPSPQYATALSIMAVSVMSSATLITFMFMKHNWARIVYTVMIGIGMIALLATSKMPTVPMILELAGIIMLYTKDATMWFKTKNGN